jgi:hypothetical protein
MKWVTGSVCAADKYVFSFAMALQINGLARDWVLVDRGFEK